MAVLVREADTRRREQTDRDLPTRVWRLTIACAHLQLSTRPEDWLRVTVPVLNRQAAKPVILHRVKVWSGASRQIRDRWFENLRRIVCRLVSAGRGRLHNCLGRPTGARGSWRREARTPRKIGRGRFRAPCGNSRPGQLTPKPASVPPSRLCIGKSRQAANAHRIVPPTPLPRRRCAVPDRFDLPDPGPSPEVSGTTEQPVSQRCSSTTRCSH